MLHEIGCVYLSFLSGSCTLLSQAIEQVVEVGWGHMLRHYRLVRLRVKGLGRATVGIAAVTKGVHAARVYRLDSFFV